MPFRSFFIRFQIPTFVQGPKEKRPIGSSALPKVTVYLSKVVTFQEPRMYVFHELLNRFDKQSITKPPTLERDCCEQQKIMGSFLCSASDP